MRNFELSTKARFLAFASLSLITAAVGVYCYQSLQAIDNINAAALQFDMPELTGKKIAMIIAFKDFRDEEYFIPKNIFEAAGAKVTTVSTSNGTAIGADGGDAAVDIAAGDLLAEDFDAVVFIGGPGAQKLIDDSEMHRIAKDTIVNDKILGAICVAPAILARAGVLDGKKATAWSSVMDKSAVKILKEGNAIYVQNAVVIDGNIITADGPDAAEDFADAIVKVLTRK